MHSFDQKLKTLRSILKDQTKYIKKFDIITVYIKDERIIIEQEKKKTNYNDLVTVAPITEIDVIIVRNRSILHQAKRKYKEIDKAIIEDDVMNLREKVKEITG